MILKNAKVFDDNFDIIDADILVEGEKIGEGYCQGDENKLFRK